MKRTTVIVDDHQAVRELMGRYLECLEYKVIGQAGTGFEAMRLFKKTAPDLAIVDIYLPELCGQEVVSRLRRELPETRILVFTGAWDAGVLNSALRGEPNGIVHKAEPLEVLVFALRIVAAGGRFFSPKISQLLRNSQLPSTQALSHREMEILQSVAEGKSNKEIAVLLGVSTKTVENHRMRLMQKLGVHNAASLTLIAVQMGVVSTTRVPAKMFESVLVPPDGVGTAAV
ncbi:MAG: response regulator transcription factor [Verrucomicrobia bacterium]|nr:response regulator transcription factor [Verrucomicrobiota bacterium]MBV8481983.1 response regulator transcription factor [Verrucomicrobiota bacterium]